MSSEDGEHHLENPQVGGKGHPENRPNSKCENLFGLISSYSSGLSHLISGCGNARTMQKTGTVVAVWGSSWGH